MKPYRICSNCVMDTTDSAITFDDKGVCDHCRTFFGTILPNWHSDERGARELGAMAERIRAAGKGREFDCIIGMSGGIDSSYLTIKITAINGINSAVFSLMTEKPPSAEKLMLMLN